MRLINTTSMRMHCFEEPPTYAILSHTWGDQEVTLQDFNNGVKKDSSGYHKILKLCELAQSRDIAYAWGDTCCIDKTNLVELTEAIQSMYKWYAAAEVCFLFLEDMAPSDLGTVGVHVDALRKCRWFTRGWCLQELLAPKDLIFFSAAYTQLGDRDSLGPTIQAITGVPSEVNREPSAIYETCVAERMSWLSNRCTTRPEDIAYCMLGIFDVNMPLFYGEGREKAFLRLQEHIIAHTNDESIFAWSEDPKPGLALNHKLGILAETPSRFAGCGRLCQMRGPPNNPRPAYHFSNRGLEFPLRSRLDPWRTPIVTLILDCADSESNSQLGIRLEYDHGTSLWYRKSTSLVLRAMWSWPQLDILPQLFDSTYYPICIARSDPKAKEASKPKDVPELPRLPQRGPPAWTPWLTVFSQGLLLAYILVMTYAYIQTNILKTHHGNIVDTVRVANVWAGLSIGWKYTGQALWMPAAVLCLSNRVLVCGRDTVCYAKNGCSEILLAAMVLFMERLYGFDRFRQHHLLYIIMPGLVLVVGIPVLVLSGFLFALLKSWQWQQV